MISRHALVLASTALLLTAAASAQETPSKAGSDFGYAFDSRQTVNNFVRHTLADFPGQTTVGDVGDDIRGLDFDPTATTLYALNHGTNQLGTLNLATGAFTAIGSSFPVTNHAWSGLSIDPVTGIFYASSQGPPVESSLYTLNPSTGEATLIGTDDDLGIVIDIAVNCSGEIFAHEIVTDSIYKLSPTTGQGTLVGPTGVNANLTQGMDFDNESGILYAYIHLGGGNHMYGTIDLGTGDFNMLFENEPPTGRFEGATQTTCGGVSPVIFVDGFESGDASRWSSTAGVRSGDE